MKLLNSFLLCGLLIFCLSISENFAADTVVVQTLTFEDITKRRGVWQFPDNTGEYRKILGLYTLKCDKRTAADIHECGEWDTGANIFVYENTGNMDSTLNSAPRYNWGRGAPDTLFYVTDPTYTIYQRSYKNIVYDDIISETEYVVGDGQEELILENKRTRLQFLYTKDFLKDNDLTDINIDRLKLFVKSPGVTLKNLTIKIGSSSGKSLDEFEDVAITKFEGDVTFQNQGWNYIDLIDTYRTTKFAGFILEICYDSIENGEELILAADSNVECLKDDNNDSYLEFDGRYDHVDCGVFDQLNGARKFTIEMRIKLDAWRNHGFFFRLGDVLQFKTAEEYRQPRRYYVRVKDDEGYGIYVGGNVDYSGKWQHFAIVYDGTLDQYGGRLKFYINGSETGGFIRGKLPDVLPDEENVLKLISESGNFNCDMDEFRIWKGALERDVIKDWMNRKVSSEHPNYGEIEAYYSMDEFDGNTLLDESGNNIDGLLIGAPAVRDFPAENQNKKIRTISGRPQITIIDGEYNSHFEENSYTKILENSPMSIVTYKLENKTVVKEDIEYVWEPGRFYTYSPDGEKIDSVDIAWTDYKEQEMFDYYSEPFEISERYEIGRAITPYGLGLDLGPEGFTWIYDFTDYAPLLTGETEISAGTQYELTDLKFLFIKGTPPRDVRKIENIWGGPVGMKYRDLSNDTKMYEKELPLLPDAEQFKIRMRMTGHGHNSDDGSYPHCCEWKDNTHYLLVNGEQKFEWKIFQYEECAKNPVFPQGGTWPGAREGWCPGDVIRERDFELAEFVEGNSLLVDYDITKVPEDNQGMGNGNYWTTVQFFQYSGANFDIDAEVYDVITPNDWEYYSRLNPICSDPIVVVRNNGKNEINSLQLEYGVSGGPKEIYNWTGAIKPNITEEITLPISGSGFWIGDDNNDFTVTISQPNGEQDEYSDNDTYTTHFEMPDLYNDQIVLNYRTNRRPGDYTFNVYDPDGNIVLEKSNLQPETLYRDTLVFKGCYTLQLTDRYHMGLSYWAYPDQGSGYLNIRDIDGNILKIFEPDFGWGINYSFHLGNYLRVKDPNIDLSMTLHPNPATNEVSLNFGRYLGHADFEIYNEIGSLIKRETGYITKNYTKRIDITYLLQGFYIIRVKTKDEVLDFTFIKK